MSNLFILIYSGGGEGGREVYETREISSSHGGEYDVQSCLLGYTAVGRQLFYTALKPTTQL
jgi:hypothetical protein